MELQRVTYEQPQFLPLNRSSIQTIEINTRSDAGELVSFGSGKSIARLIFRGIISLMYRLPAFKGAAPQRGMKII